MKKNLILLFLLLIQNPVFSQFFKDKDFHLSVEPFVSYTTGQIDESIFYSGKNSDKKQSLLEWERKFFLYGLNLETEYKRLSADFSFASSFLTGFGEMRDSDWKNESDYSMKTTYSVGDISADSNYEIYANIGFDFVPLNCLKITPSVKVKYNYDYFSRATGIAKGWYGDESSDGKYHWWYDDEAKKYPYDKWDEKTQTWKHGYLMGIDYERHFLSTLIGINFELEPVSKLNLIFSAFVSPFSYSYAIDTHYFKYKPDGVNSIVCDGHKRQIQFCYFSNLNFNFDINYKITDIVEAVCGISTFFSVKTTRGTLFQDYIQWYSGSEPIDEYYDTGFDSGLDNFEFSVKLGTKINIM